MQYYKYDIDNLISTEVSAYLDDRPICTKDNPAPIEIKFIEKDSNINWDYRHPEIKEIEIEIEHEGFSIPIIFEECPNCKGRSYRQFLEEEEEERFWDER